MNKRAPSCIFKIGLVVVFCLLASVVSAQRVSGKIIDNKKQPLPGAIVLCFNSSGVLCGGTIADDTGGYISPRLDPGIYTLIAKYSGYDSVIVKSVVVTDFGYSKINFELKENESTIIHFVSSRQPGIKIDMDYPTRRIFTRNNIDHLPNW